MTRTMDNCNEHRHYWICKKNNHWCGYPPYKYCTGYSCCETEAYGTYINKIAYATHNVIDGQWSLESCNSIAALCGVSMPISCVYNSSARLYQITNVDAPYLIAKAIDHEQNIPGDRANDHDHEFIKA